MPVVAFTMVFLDERGLLAAILNRRGAERTRENLWSRLLRGVPRQKSNQFDIAIHAT